MRFSIWIGILALAVTLAVPAQAQTQTGSVRVRVRVEGAEKGIAGAKLTLTPSVEPSEIGAIIATRFPANQDDLLVYLMQLAVTTGTVDGELNIVVGNGTRLNATFPTAVTDIDGNAAFQGVKLGHYILNAQHPDYLGAAVSRSDGFVGPYRTPSTSIAVTVDQARLAPQATLFLSPVAAISGRVRNIDGSPAANVSVVLGNIRDDGGHRVFVATLTGKTDTAGEYRLSDVGPGEYVIRIARGLPASSSAPPVYFPGDADLEKAALIFVEPGKDLVGIDLTLP